jgi:Domain of unknown function (DUF4156)
MIRRSLCVLAVAATVGACSWVQLTAGGDRVRVGTPAEVASCQELGTASGTTTSRFFGFIPRDADTILDEQTRLARNRAADLGGNTRGWRRSGDRGQCFASCSSRNPTRMQWGAPRSIRRFLAVPLSILLALRGRFAQ